MLLSWKPLCSIAVTIHQLKPNPLPRLCPNLRFLYRYTSHFSKLGKASFSPREGNCCCCDFFGVWKQSRGSEEVRPRQSYHTVYTNTKAGMEGMDKKRVQRIVYEMSKGSKYFENEEREKIDNRHAQCAKLTAILSFWSSVKGMPSS